MPGQVEQLEPVPTIQTDGFAGYQHFMDPTRLPFNVLTYPSINCMIPSRDKIVPRKGKTRLGQGFSKEEVDIGFDNFSSKEELAGGITEFTPLDFDHSSNSSSAFNSSVKIDSTHYLNFWGDDVGEGWMQVFEVNLTTGVMAPAADAVRFTGVFNGYNSCGQVDANHFIIIYTGPSFHGWAQIVEVDLTTWILTLKDVRQDFTGGGAFYNSCVKVDATHYLNFWQDADAVDGKAQVLSINLATWAIGLIGSPLVFEATNISWNSCGQVDTTRFINFYTDVANHGKAIVVAVNLGTYAVTTFIAAITFDSSSNAFNSCVKVDSTHFLNFWRGSAGAGLARVFSINIGGTSITALGSAFTFYAGADVSSIACASFGDGINFIAFWANSNNQYAQILAINASAGTFEALGTGPLNFGTNTTGRFNSVVSAGDGINFINFWVEIDNAGKVALFKTNLLLTSESLEHPCAGDNRILFVSILTRNTGGGDRVTAVTYNGVAMTLGAKVAVDSTSERYLYYLINPDAGIFGESDGVVVTTNSIDRKLTVAASSYFGAKQSAPTIKSTVGPNAAVTSISISETTVDDESWIVVLFGGGAVYDGGLSEGANTIFRGGNTNFQMADRGPISPAGATALVADFDSSTTAIAIAIAFSPKGGTPANKNWPIIGHKKRFTNDGGYTFEVRVVRTDDVGMGDQIEILFPNPLTDEKEWYPITEITNPLEQGTADKYYMDSFFDTNLNPAISFKNSRLVWVNDTKTIFSWSGGVNPISAVVPGVSITGVVGKSWISQGFPHLSNSFTVTETRYVVVNGRKYLVSGGWETDTLLLSNTAGIQVGDVATAHIAPPESNIPIQDVIVLPDTFPNIDFCRQNKNYMFYGGFASRQLFMSNNFNRPPIEAIVPSGNILQDDLSIPLNPDFTGSTVVIFRISIDGTTPDTFDWQATNSSGEIFESAFGIHITGGFQALISPFGGITIKFQYAAGHAIGDTWTITCSPAIGEANFLGDTDTPPAWANFFYNLPRVPGQGYIFFLPANFWAMESQEEDMYISDQYGNWSYINTQIAADLQSETITFTPLKQISASKPIFPYMVGHMENYIVFVTENKTLDFIGRQAFLELPQMSYLSQPVALDFEASTFELGSLEYLNKILYITSPKESVMLVYDNRNENKYWQPPQIYTENGILSIVENTLISHSYLRDQTFNLFKGDKGDDGAEYTVRARTSLTPYFKLVARHRIPARWDSKISGNSFVEGYITGNPQLIFTAFVAPNDPTGYSHTVKPVITDNPLDTASIGEAILGAHPLGSDLALEGSYFNEIYRDFKPILNYYFIALQIACVAKTHSYSILSLGVNMSFTPTGNNSLIGDREVL